MANNRIPKWPFIATAILIALVVALLLAIQAANRAPVVRIPTPVLPNPNAYDYYVSAGKMIEDASKFPYAVDDPPLKPPVMVPSAPPPFAVASAPGLPPAPPGTAAPTPPPSPPAPLPYTPAEREALVRRNATALKTLREGFLYDYRRPRPRSFGASPLVPGKSLAELLVLEGQTGADRGDYAAAMDSYLDALRLGHDLPRGGAMIDMLVGYYVQVIARKSAWKTVHKMNAVQARNAAARLEKMMSRSVPFADTLQEEKWRLQASMAWMFNQPGWRRDFVAWTEIDKSPAMKIKMMFISKRGILAQYTAHMDECIAGSRKPYATSKEWPNEPNDPISLALMPSFNRAQFVSILNDTQNALLIVTLALRAYRLEHGKYPASLAELSPGYLGYLRKIPNDPFSAKSPLKYKRVGARYVLYSLGPDCMDDGGLPIGGPVTSGAPVDHASRSSQVDSKGDIVAGENPR